MRILIEFAERVGPRLNLAPYVTSLDRIGLIVEDRGPTKGGSGGGC